LNDHRKKLGKAIPVRMSAAEFSYLKEESVHSEVSMARILVHSFTNRERPTRESLRQREEVIFLLGRLHDHLRTLRRDDLAFDVYHSRTLDSLTSDLRAALVKVGAAYSRREW
jgi:hypothetical protein